MKDFREIIKRPIITEKSSDLMAEGKYTFAVDKKANKVEIKNAIENLFPGVKVKQVNTMTVGPKKRRVGKHEGFRPGYKKAIVQLAEGNTIELFEV
jgi:large subunit ribosomal protein L23